VIPLFLRLALAIAFLSAVADRFGLWGPAGSAHIAWGNFDRFIQYTARINPWAPSAVVPVLSWTATVLEVLLSAMLILGFFTAEAAFASGVLLSLFGLGMTMGTGIKSALDASVFSAAAGAFALSLLGTGPLSLDGFRRKED
jgi:uncharacterized membrane protein YphA (DoxX/SURF4 family)